MQRAVADVVYALTEREPALVDAAVRRLEELTAGSLLDPAVAAVLIAAFHARYAATGHVDDLDRAVAAGERARIVAEVKEGSNPHRVALTANLANTHRLRYEALGLPDDLDAGIDLGRAALRSRPLGPDEERVVLNNLALCLRSRAQRDGSVADVDEAVELSGCAVELAGMGHPERVAVLTNSGGAHHVRYELTGDLGSLQRAIELGRAAVGAAGPRERLRAALLTNLSATLQLRAERVGDGDDIDESVELARAAVTATAPDDPLLPARLANLSTAQLVRFDHTDDPDHLDAAIGSARQALATTPPTDPARAGRAANLSAGLRTRFEHRGDRADLDDALACARMAVAVDEGSPARVARLSALATVLRTLFREDRDVATATEAANVLGEAVALSPPDSPDRAAVLSNLGAVRYELHEYRPDAALSKAAEEAFREASAVRTARPRVRVATSSSWGRVAAERGDFRSALDGLRSSVELLGLLAPADLSGEDQQRGLRRHVAVAADAAACAIELGDVEHALALLELGRGILLRQIVDARSDLGSVAVQAPELARHLDVLRQELDLTGLASATPGLRPRDRRVVAAELDAVFDRIRALPDLADFLRPPPVADLLPLAQPGPIVVLNVSELRCDALVVEPHGVRSCPLPQLSAREVVRRARALNDREPGEGPVEAELVDLLAWLWDAVTGPVLADLGQESPPRIWWVPTGPLSFLPLHAARSEAGECALDRTVSSFVPTLHALAFARRAGVSVPDRGLVAAPVGPGIDPLPGAAQEARAVAALLGCPSTVLLGSGATRTAIMTELGRASWMHVAGHATSDPTMPSRSSIAAHDADGRALNVTDLAGLNLGHAQGAFLSACTTSRSTVELADEALHLTSACQLAGFRHVVGTLWPVGDRVALHAARSYYRALTAGGSLDGDRSASAVGRAVRDLRLRFPDRPSSWAGYVHAGA